MTRTILIETSWLAGALFGATFICHLLFNINIHKGTADVQVYDTYLVFSVEKFVIAVFFLLTFGSYLIRAIWQRFSRALPNSILLAAGLLLLLATTRLNNYPLTEAVPIGYVVYPPLAAIPTTPVGNNTLIKLTATVVNSLAVFQLLVIATLLYAAFQWANKRDNFAVYSLYHLLLSQNVVSWKIRQGVVIRLWRYARAPDLIQWGPLLPVY